MLGGAYDLPHAQTHAVVLPHVLAYNAPAVPEAANRLAQAFQTQSCPAQETALAGLLRLYDAVGPPRSLRELGLDEARIPEAAALVAEAAPADNPRPVTRDDAERLLRDAWAGHTPADSQASGTEGTHR